MVGQGERELRRIYPAEPWRWRADWALGRSESTTRRVTVAGAWAFALLWSLVSCPLLIVLPEQIRKGNRLAIIGFLFPLIGLLLFARAVRETALFQRFGVSVFEMREGPYAPGGRLIGDIRAHCEMRPEEGFHLRLTCVRRSVSGGGKDRTISEKILWRSERTMTRPLPADDPSRTLIPVSFEIPADLPTTTLDDPDDRILWALEVEARMKGPDYHAQFEIPVFQRAGAAAAPAANRAAGTEDPMAAYEAPETAYRPGDDARVRVQPSAGGGTEFYFAAGRNPAAAFGLSLFLLIWCGSFWFLLHVGAPLIFPIVIGTSGLLLCLIVLELWLGTTRVVFESGVVRVTSGLLGVGPTRMIPCSAIKDTRLVIEMQSGDRSGTPYYTVNLIDADDRRTSAGSYIKDKKEAEWVAAEMLRLARATRA